MAFSGDRALQGLGVPALGGQLGAAGGRGGLRARSAAGLRRGGRLRGAQPAPRRRRLAVRVRLVLLRSRSRTCCGTKELGRKKGQF